MSCVISVVIPTYNPGTYLLDCILSLQNQTLDHKLFEVIIILNGCNQPYRNDIQEMITSMSNLNLNLIQTDLPGVSNARNIGLELGKGEYICFIDDDDIISEQYLELLLKISSVSCIGVTCSYSFEKIIEERKSNFITKAYQKCLYRNKYSLLYYRSFFSSPWAKLIHREIIGNKRFNTAFSISEDSLFFASISKNVKKMQLTSEEAVYYFRKRSESATRRKFSFHEVIFFTIKIQKEYFKIYFTNIKEYNFLFFMTRIFASFTNAVSFIKNV